MHNALLMTLILPFSWIFAKYCINQYGAIDTVYFRVILTSLALIFICVFFRKNQFELLKKKWIGILFLAVFGFVLYFTFITLSLEISLPSQTGLCMALLPSIGYILSVLTKQESIDILRISGLALSLAGAVVFYLSYDASNSIAGLFLSLCAVISYSIYGAIYQKSFKEYDNLIVLSLSAFIAAV